MPHLFFGRLSSSATDATDSIAISGARLPKTRGTKHCRPLLRMACSSWYVSSSLPAIGI